MKTEDLKKKCEEIVKKYMPGKETIDLYVEALMALARGHAVDWQSRMKTGEILGSSRKYAYLSALEEVGLLIKRPNRRRYFIDGFDRRNTAFDHVGAEAIERRNFREILRHIRADANVKKVALDVSGTANVEDLMRILEGEGPGHKTYNKIVEEIKKKHMDSRAYAYGVMGSRRFSDTWYLSPVAIRLLSELPELDLFKGPHNRYIVPGV